MASVAVFASPGPSPIWDFPVPVAAPALPSHTSRALPLPVAVT